MALEFIDPNHLHRPIAFSLTPKYGKSRLSKSGFTRGEAMFIGRKEELNALRDFYDEDGFGLGFICGKKRIGKSHLIKESIRRYRPNKYIYYQAEKVNEAAATESFLNNIRETLKVELGSFPKFLDALKAVLDLYKNEKIIIAIDEYPYLKRYIPGLDSSLQSLVDSLSDSSKAKILLCGSYMSSMRDSMGEGNGPLRGRERLSINLGPLSYLESREFFPSLSVEESFTLHSLFGGIPYYLSLYKGKESLRDNVVSLLLKGTGTLRNEASIILEELSDESSANMVLSIVASGIHEFKRIYQKSRLNSSASTSYVLSRLLDMNLLRKEKMVGSNDSRYYLDDPFLSFYYRYVFSKEGEIFLYGEESYFDEVILPKLLSYDLPRHYERVSSEFLALCSRNKKGRRFLELGGATFHNEKENGEFDIVGRNKDGIYIYECKYESSPLSLGEVIHLEEQGKKSKLEVKGYGFFAKSSFSSDALSYIENKGYDHFTLEEVYSLKLD